MIVAQPVPAFTLNPLVPDYDNILVQIQSQLANFDSWTDIITAGTGETLTEMIASVGAFNQEAIERSLQEAFLDTALLPSSIYIISRMLAVHILRKTPASVPVTFSRNDPTDDGSQAIVVPAYTQWSISNTPFFNRTPIILNVGQFSVTGTLYQGQAYVENYQSDGTPFQIFYIGTSDFQVSDQDLFALVGTDYYTKITNGLWHYNSNDLVFYENTLPDGRVEVWFGNGIYGALPPANVLIQFQYIITLGSGGNNDNSGLTAFSSTFNNTVIGKTTDVVSQGGDNRDPTFYKIMAPSIFSAKERGVTRTDCRALALEYPNVIDALFRGQAEINPGDLRWMNVLAVTLLTNPVWSDNQWAQFVNSMVNTQTMATCRLKRVDPTPVNIIVNLMLYCFNRVDLNSAISAATTAIQNLFQLQLGSLGRQYKLSDLYTLILGLTDSQGDLIDYIEVTYPTADISLTPIQYANLASLTVNASYSPANRSNSSPIIVA